MANIISNESRRARKPHKCYYCGGKIEVGEKYGYRTGETYGDFWDMKFHPECDHQACNVERWDDGDFECFEQGTMQRPAAGGKA